MKVYMKGKRRTLCLQSAYEIWHLLFYYLIFILESVKYLEVYRKLC